VAFTLQPRGLEEELVMRGVFAFLMMGLAAIDGARASADPECLECDLAVTIQIHDYASVSSQSWSRATNVVSRLYGKIGVRTEWIGVVRPGERRAHSSNGHKSGRVPIGQLTVIVLTPQMAARGRVADGVLGYAAVPMEGMGRIAFVIYDRVRQWAAKTATDEVELLGFVMAHEIGHLLLPPGTQSETGLMKGHWNLLDLRQLDVRELEFPALEARRVRKTLEDNATTIAANAIRAGSNPDTGVRVPPNDHVADDPNEPKGALIGR
jgi:hypothetical protein